VYQLFGTDVIFIARQYTDVRYW